MQIGLVVVDVACQLSKLGIQLSTHFLNSLVALLKLTVDMLLQLPELLICLPHQGLHVGDAWVHTEKLLLLHKDLHAANVANLRQLLHKGKKVQLWRLWNWG